MKSYKQLSYEELAGKDRNFVRRDYLIHEMAIKLSRNKSTIYRYIKQYYKNSFSADTIYELIKSRKL